MGASPSDDRPGQEIGASRPIEEAAVRALLGAVNLCFGLAERLSRIRPGSRGAERILVLRTAALGDYVLSIPALQRVRKAFPASRIVLLTAASTDAKTLKTVEAYSNRSSPWLTLTPAGTIDEVIEFSAPSAWDLLGNAGQVLAGREFDKCFVVTEGIGLTLLANAKKLFFLRMLGVGCRVYGIRVRAYPKLFPWAQRGDRRLEHHVPALMRSVEEDPSVAATPFEIATPYVRSGEDGAASGRVSLAGLELGGGPLVIVAPGSRLEFKRWPSASFSTVVRALLLDSKAEVLMVGSGPEAKTIKEVLSGLPADLVVSPRLHNLAGATTLDQLTAYLGRAALFIGNDGGTCHLAAAAGCRVVSISNGAEFPNSVEPWANQRFTARHNVSCSPCYCFTECPLGNNKCVTGITPDLVLALVRKALGEFEVQHAQIGSP